MPTTGSLLGTDEDVSLSQIPLSNDIHTNCLKHRQGSCPACHKLVALDSEIEDAHHTLESLRKKREGLSALLNEHHDPFVHRFPVEIVTRIFIYYRRYPPSISVFDGSFDEAEHIKALLLLGRVCRRWRDISRSIPELWTVFSLTLTLSNCVLSVPYAQEWLERSGNRPLFINIDVHDGREPIVTMAGHKILASAIVHAGRWRVVDLSLPSRWLPWLTDTLSSRSMTLLEDLAFGVTDRPRVEDVLCLNATPLSFCIRKGLFMQIQINRDRLTHFTAPGVVLSLGECRQVLLDSPNLRFFSVHEVEGPTEEHTVITNSSVRTIIINNFPDTFWDHFTLPSLDTLHFSDPDHYDADARGWDPVLDLIRRSDCKIKELWVGDRDIADYYNVVIDVFRMTPDLERLTLTQLEGLRDEPFFGELDAACTADKPFLSKLSSFTCETSGLAFEWSHLLIFLATMSCSRPRALRLFTFTYSLPEPCFWESGLLAVLDKDTCKHIQQVTQGLKTCIIYGGEDVFDQLRRTYNL